MYRVIEYTVFFVIVVLLQVFLFNNLNLSVYLNPLVYIAFIVLLPMGIAHVALLSLGLLLGLTMDLIMGTAGINTIATLLTAFIRPLILLLIVGKQEVKDGGIPTAGRLGMAKYIRYSLIVITIQCLVFFTFESLSWSYYHHTLLRVLFSTLLTTILAYFASMLVDIKGRSKI